MIPSHNLDCERNLSVAGEYMEQSSKCSNRHFKSRCIRDDVTLHKSTEINKISQELRSILDTREQTWYDQQRKLKSEQIEAAIVKGKNRDNFVAISCKM